MADARCRKCGKPINFIRMRSGKCMPVEPKGLYCVRDEHGPISLVTQAGVMVRVSEGFKGDAGVMIGYVPHWQNCTGAAEVKREYAQRRESTNSGGKQQWRRGERQAQPPKPEPPTHEQISLFGGMR